MKVFLDTDILVDYLLERSDSYQQILQILSSVIDGYIEACVSSITIVNANYICVERKRTTIDEYKRKLNAIRPYIAITSVDSTDIYNSYDAQWEDFEDGVQYYSAKRAGCDYIVTRNEDDFELSSLPVLSPTQMTELLYDKFSRKA